MHQQPKLACGRRSFRDQHQAARLAIESVHDGNLFAGCDLECEEVAELFPERGCIVWLGRMNQKKWWLFDDDVIIVFINNFKIGQWLNRVIEEGIGSSSKLIARIGGSRNP